MTGWAYIAQEAVVPIADVAGKLFGGCIAAGLLLGAVVALVNSWRA